MLSLAVFLLTFVRPVGGRARTPDARRRLARTGRRPGTVAGRGTPSNPPPTPPPPPAPPAPPRRPADRRAPPEETGDRRVESGRRAAAADEEEEEYQELAPRPNAKGDAFGDEPENAPKTKGFAFRLLLQTRYTQVFDDASVKDAESNDGFALNRAFLRGVVHPYKWLSAKLLVDFAEFAYSNPQQALKLAYGEIKPIKRIELTFGLFKRTYSLLELLPIAEYELADTGPTDNLIKDTQFGGRDAGAMLRGDPLPKRRWLHIYLGAFGGAGEGAEGIPGTTGNVNTGPDLAAPSLLLTARLMSRPLKHLSLGADGAWRPNGTPAVPFRRRAR